MRGSFCEWGEGAPSIFFSTSFPPPLSLSFRPQFLVFFFCCPSFYTRRTLHAPPNTIYCLKELPTLLLLLLTAAALRSPSLLLPRRRRGRQSRRPLSAPASSAPPPPRRRQQRRRRARPSRQGSGPSRAPRRAPRRGTRRRRRRRRRGCRARQTSAGAPVFCFVFVFFSFFSRQLQHRERHHGSDKSVEERGVF